MSRHSSMLLLSLLLPFSSASCIDDPTPPSCRTYHYPNASSDLSMVCGMMPSMAGCSVRKQCSLGGAVGAACDGFSLLTATCHSMPMMMGCHAATSLCQNGTSVEACADEPPSLKRMPSASDAKKAAIKVCDMMPKMSACTSCASPDACPDPLLSLGKLCREMPGMAPCAAWESWCRAPGSEHDLPAYCKGAPHNPNGPGDVPMRMYFHTGWTDYILLESWVPQSAGSYAASLLAVCLAAVVSAWLRALRNVFECHAYAKKAKRRTLLTANLARAGLVMLSSALDYLLMLVAMTFNVGLFVAVILGFGLGTVGFGHWGRSPPKEPADNAVAFLQPPPTSPTANEVGGCH